MTEEYKERLIAKMLDAPSSLSDEELEAIVNDEELSGIYEMSAQVGSACVRQPEIDIDKEWAAFQPRLRRRRRPAMARLMRVAAIFTGVALVSGVIVKMSEHTLAPSEPAAVAKAEDQLPVRESRQSIAAASEESDPDVNAADEVEKKAAAVSTYGRKTVSSNSKLAKVEKVEPAGLDEMISNIDVDEYIRIQQAKVDNDLAMQNVELYDAQRFALSQMIDMIDGAGDLDTENVKTKIML